MGHVQKAHRNPECEVVIEVATFMCLDGRGFRQTTSTLNKITIPQKRKQQSTTRCAQKEELFTLNSNRPKLEIGANNPPLAPMDVIDEVFLE